MNYKYIDIHAHLNINAFKDDYWEVIKRTREEGVAHINIGTQQNTSVDAVRIASECEDGVYAVIGLHPIHTSASYHDEKELGGSMKGFNSRSEKFDPSFYKELAKSKKVVAVGECGLDYFRQSYETKELQEEAFIAQIEFANELGLPLMIHTRDAKGNQASSSNKYRTSDVLYSGDIDRSVYDDAYEILKKYAKVPGNLHFYAGNYLQAKKFFDIGFSISFTGVITFARDYDDVVKNSPLDMLHGETDSPYVAPVPHRGKRCEPLYVKEVYKKIAELRGDNEENVRAQLVENGRRLFGIL